MVRWPWTEDRGGDSAAHAATVGAEPIHVCEFQDGTLSIYDDHVFIERAGPSSFENKTIARDEIVDVTYSKGIAIGYLQIEQDGLEPDAGGFLTKPVDENTLHFGRGDRECAEHARDELLFGADDDVTATG